MLYVDLVEVSGSAAVLISKFLYPNIFQMLTFAPDL